MYRDIIKMTLSNENFFRVTGHLCGEFTGHRWIPLTKASDVELWCFLWSAWINGWVNKREAGNLRRHRAHYGVTVMSTRRWNGIMDVIRPSNWLGTYPMCAGCVAASFNPTVYATYKSYWTRCRLRSENCYVLSKKRIQPRNILNIRHVAVWTLLALYTYWETSSPSFW